MKLDSRAEKPVRRLREQLKLVAADAILAAAEQVFAEHGPQARMEAIAARAGVAVGTLYNHFADRETLLQTLLASRRQLLVDKLDAALDETKGRPFDEQVERFVRALMEHSVAHAAFFTMLSQTERKAHAIDELDARVRKLMQRGVAQKALRNRHLELWAAAFWGMLRGVVLGELRLARAEHLPELAGPLTTLFLRGAGA